MTSRFPTGARSRPAAQMSSRWKPVPGRPLDSSSARWDAQALRGLWSSSLDGDQVIVVSNREPWIHERIDDTMRVTQPASGMITAVEPVVRACSGTWIAHGSGGADSDVVDDGDTWQVCPLADGYRLRRVWLTADERYGHQEQFSNAGLWPLCHGVSVGPAFDERDWHHYRIVNQRFADAVVEEARQPDPIVLVQDYLLALVPAMVRKRLPQATIVTFWHIPWAAPEHMEECPWLPELMDGLLGSDIVGLQTPLHRGFFVDAADRHARRTAATIA